MNRDSFFLNHTAYYNCHECGHEGVYCHEYSEDLKSDKFGFLRELAMKDPSIYGYQNNLTCRYWDPINVFSNMNIQSIAGIKALISKFKIMKGSVLSLDMLILNELEDMVLLAMKPSPSARDLIKH